MQVDPHDPISRVFMATYVNKPEWGVDYGQRAYARGFSNRACQVFADTVRRYPAYVPAREKLALVLFQTGHQAEAIDQCEQALHLAPDPDSIALTTQMLRGMLAASGEDQSTIDLRVAKARAASERAWATGAA